MTPTVACVFRHAAALGVSREALLAALQTYLDRDVGPAWGVAARVVERAPAAGDWPLYVLDDAQDAGELGHHDDDGTPHGYVFVATAWRDGEQPSAVAAHEAAEMVINPHCDLVVPTPRGRLVAPEIADGVEGPGYLIDGVTVSNFCLPGWYGRPSPGGGSAGGRYDYLGRCAEPWEVLPTGYVPVWTGSGWSAVFGSAAAHDAYHRADRRYRRLHRMQWRRAPALPGTHGRGGPGAAVLV